MCEQIYAGVGARKTPPDVLALMERVAFRLARRGYALRTGGAEGADAAFLRGAMRAGGRVELMLPWFGFNGFPRELPESVFVSVDPPPEAYAEAEAVHPGWQRLKESVRRLHARNAQIILGAGLDCPVRFVVLWTEGGAKRGGTGIAWRIAERHGVPVVNLHDGQAALEQIARLLSSK